MTNASYAIVIVHYNDAVSVRRLCVAISQWTILPDRVIVVDNSSNFTGGNVDFDVSVSVLAPGSNIGYGAAINLAFREYVQGKYPYFLIATQDAWLSMDAVEAMVEVIESNDNIGIAAPRLSYSSRPELLFSNGGVITRSGRTLHPDQGRRMDDIPVEGPFRVVDWADGACMLVRATAFGQVNGFRDEFFLYVEEVDLQVRLAGIGFPTAVVTTAIARQEPGNYTLYLKYRNLTYFTRLHNDIYRPWPWFIAWHKDSLRMVLSGRPSQPFWAIRGLIDSWRGRFGPPPRTIWSR